MIQYIIRRTLWFIPVLLAVTVFTFTLVRVIPGGPFDRIGDKTLPPEIVANLEAKYHLDKPVWQQYLITCGICFILTWAPPSATAPAQ